MRRQRREYIAASMRLDLYRAIDLETLEQVVRRQEKADRTPMIRGRRRVTSKLKPGTERLLDSTLHVRRSRGSRQLALA